MADPLSAELEFARALVAEAAGIARERSGRVTPQEKGSQYVSYVTDLDHDLEQLIRRRLGERFPDDVLTGEEYAAAGGQGPRRWSIDPIDGTGNLVQHLPLWAVSIGLLDAGEPVLGVIAIPLLGEMYWATRGFGAWRDGVRLQVRDSDTFHIQDNLCICTNALRTLDPRSLPGRLRDLGSSCCEQVFTASGRLAACVMLGEAAHDVAAASVITSEAGCRFANLDGRYLSPSQLVAETPLRSPTFVAPPRRLEALLRTARRLEPSP